jgi:hypothetical protein
MKDLLRNSRDFLIENPDIDELKFYKMYSYFFTNLQRHFTFQPKINAGIKKRMSQVKPKAQIEMMEQMPHLYDKLAQDYKF